MSGEFDIYGVYFPALAVFAAIAFVVQLSIKRLLDATGFYRLVWHRRVGRSGDLRNLRLSRHHGGGNDYLATGMSH